MAAPAPRLMPTLALAAVWLAIYLLYVAVRPAPPAPSTTSTTRRSSAVATTTTTRPARLLRP